MIEHFLIEPLSYAWCIGILCSSLFIFSAIYFLKNRSYIILDRFSIILSFSFLVAYIITNLIAIYNSTWSFHDNLPLHLCRVSFLICIVVLIKKKQWMYEWVLFLAIPSGIHAILTPEMTKGVSAWFYFDFYFIHSSLILVPLYLTLIKGMRPRINSWWRTVLRLQILVVIVFPLNFLIDSNYMYLREKPLANNPFLIGDWPIYIIFLEIVMIIHVFIIHKFASKILYK